MSERLDGPLTEHERAHLRDELARRVRSANAFSLFFGLLMTGVLGFFTYLIADIHKTEAYIVAAILGAAALGVFYFFVLKIPAERGPASPDYLVAVIEGDHDWRLVGAGKYQERKELIGDVIVECPPHWRSAILGRRGMRGRIAILVPGAANVPSPPGDLLELAGGPSIDFERAQGFGPCPSISPWPIVGATLTAVLAMGFFYAGTERLEDVGRDLGALGHYFAQDPVYPDAAALIASPPATSAPVVIEAAWVAPVSHLSGFSGRGAVLLTDAGRAQALAEREQAAAVYRDAYAVYQAALDAWSTRVQETSGFRVVGDRLEMTHDAGPRPVAPKIAAAQVNPDAAAAALSSAVLYGLSGPAEGEDPLSGWLSQPRRLRVVPTAARDGLLRFETLEGFENRAERAVSLLAGLFGILLVGVFVLAGLRQSRRQRAYRDAVAAAYRAAGRRFDGA